MTDPKSYQLTITETVDVSENPVASGRYARSVTTLGGPHAGPRGGLA